MDNCGINKADGLQSEIAGVADTTDRDGARGAGMPRTGCAQPAARVGSERARGSAWRGLAESSDGEARRSLGRLRSALRRERRLGEAGHWAYSITRHLALAHQVRQAEAALSAA